MPASFLPRLKKCLTLSVLNNFFNFVTSAEYVYTGLCCITPRVSVDFYR